MLQGLPSQTVRSDEQVSFQQFSTPPNYAAAAAAVYAANLRRGDVVMGPSAGTGSIVAAAIQPDVQILANELAPRRAALLRELIGNRGRVFTEDAEQLNNILGPEQYRPTVVVMNPPFSQTAGRLGNKRDIHVGARHIEQGLKRLQPGGRLVTIVGRGMTMGAPAFKEWRKKIGGEYKIVANIGVDGKVYQKYGTNFGTRVIVIDKVPPDGARPTLADVETIPALMAALEAIRDARPETETRPAQPSRPETPAEELRRPGQSARGTGVVGAGPRAGAPEVAGGDREPGPRVGLRRLPGSDAVDAGRDRGLADDHSGGRVAGGPGDEGARPARQPRPGSPRLSPEEARERAARSLLMEILERWQASRNRLMVETN
jgi:hypothetical protein